jgi:hypothetical protein
MYTTATKESNNTNHRAFKASAIVALVIAAIVFMIPRAAFGASSPPLISQTQDGNVVYTYTYPSNEAAPTVDKSITYENAQYNLTSQSTPAPDATYKAATKVETKDVTQTVNISDMDNLTGVFPATQAIDDGEFKGDISLDASTPFSQSADYSTQSAGVDKYATYTDLPTNEAGQIPQQRAFTVRDASAVNATISKELTLADTHFSVASTDAAGQPATWNCDATYRGEESWLVLTAYDVTAHYSGTLTSDIGQNTFTATYAPVVVASDDAQTVTAPALPLWPFLVGGGGAAAAIVVVGGVVIWRRRYRLVRLDERGNKVVAHLKARKADDMHFLTVPSTYDLSVYNQYALMPPKKQVRLGRIIRVWQSNEVIFQGAAKEQIALFNAPTGANRKTTV